MPILLQDIVWVRVLQRASKFPDTTAGYFTGVKLVDHDTLMTTFTDERDDRIVSLISKDNGATWTEWAVQHPRGGHSFGNAFWDGMGTSFGLFKSGIGSPAAGHAIIGADWSIPFFVAPQPSPAGFFSAEIRNHHHWNQAWDGLVIPYNATTPWADFGVTCGWANLPNSRIACGQYSADGMVSSNPTERFFLVKTLSNSGRSGWIPHGGDADLYPFADPFTNQSNLDGLMTVYPIFNHPHATLGNDNTLLVGARMASRRPRMFWNLEGGYGGTRNSQPTGVPQDRHVTNWHEVVMPGHFEPYTFDTFVNAFGHLGNGVILAGGGAPTIAGGGSYYHYPQLWRSNNPDEDPLDTWENISLNIGHFATTLPLSGQVEYRVNEILPLGDGNAVLGLHVDGANDFPFWFTNDNGDSFPSPGVFSRPEACDYQIVTQMTMTPAGLIAASMIVHYVGDPNVSFKGEVWVGLPLILIVQAALEPARSVGFMEQREFLAGFPGLGRIPLESNPWPPGEPCAP